MFCMWGAHIIRDACLPGGGTRITVAGIGNHKAFFRTSLRIFQVA